jgi:hypothetical protein
MSDKLREISTGKESIDFLTNILTGARERTYNLIAGKNKAIKDKVDTIYNICKRIFTSNNVEKVNKVFSSELYTRTISLIENYSSVLKSFRTLTRNTKNKDRAYLNSLRDQYFILFGDSEILLNYCMQ